MKAKRLHIILIVERYLTRQRRTFQRGLSGRGVTVRCGSLQRRPNAIPKVRTVEIWWTHGRMTIVAGRAVG
ncbi:MAG: hypothetical protein HY695_16405 [Deltaproteobacteria bacterium]|nr:hypothetical protein [Deltaproteobacteria bacterium]